MDRAQAPAGTSQSSYYAYYPDETGAQSAYDGVGNFFKTYLATLKHEGKLLDSINLLPLYSSAFLNDGKNFDIETGFQATFLRTVKVSSLTRGAITVFLPNTPNSNNNVIGLDRTGAEGHRSEIGLFRLQQEQPAMFVLWQSAERAR